MQVVRLPKAQTLARLELTSSGGKIHAVISVQGSMQGIREFGSFESVEEAEASATDFARRNRAEVLYIEDRT